MFIPFPFTATEADALAKSLLEYQEQLNKGAQPAPVNVIYPAPDPTPESEEQRKERMWRAVVESCGRSK